MRLSQHQNTGRNRHSEYCLSERSTRRVIGVDNARKTCWALLSGLRCQCEHSGLYWVSSEESGALEVKREIKVLPEQLASLCS